MDVNIHAEPAITLRAAFEKACADGNESQVKDLLCFREVSFDVGDGVNSAYISGHLNILQMLLSRPNTQFQRNLILWIAVQDGRQSVVELLVKTYEYLWETAVTMAWEYDQFSILSFLLQYKLKYFSLSEHSILTFNRCTNTVKFDMLVHEYDLPLSVYRYIFVKRPTLLQKSLNLLRYFDHIERITSCITLPDLNRIVHAYVVKR